MSRPPPSPYTAETAAQKARLAEDAWNTSNPARVAQAYTIDGLWRIQFLQGRDAIEAIHARRGSRELLMRTRK